MDDLSFDGLHIPVLGRICTVTESELTEDDGLFHPSTFSIEIRKDLHIDDKLTTLFHELGHAVLDRLGVHFGNEMLEEIIVVGFENLFKETFSADPLELISRFKVSQELSDEI